MRVPSRSLLLLILAVFVVSPGASGQSTSRWIRISDGTIGDPTLVRPSPGSTYVTSVFRDASIYPRSNWWTKVIQSQRQAVLTIAIDGTIRGIHIQDTRVSNPIELRKYDKNISFGFSDVPIIQNVPTTFDAISLTVTLNKTAKDG